MVSLSQSVAVYAGGKISMGQGGLKRDSLYARAPFSIRASSKAVWLTWRPVVIVPRSIVVTLLITLRVRCQLVSNPSPAPLKESR